MGFTLSIQKIVGETSKFKNYQIKAKLKLCYFANIFILSETKLKLKLQFYLNFSIFDIFMLLNGQDYRFQVK